MTMMTRDAAIDALLPFVADLGWSFTALRQAAGPDAELLFPGGPVEMVLAYIDLANRRMVEAAAPLMDNQRLSQKVRTLIATRLQQATPHRAAIRRAIAVLALSGKEAAGSTARTVDTIWRAAGDQSAGFSWYTKRAILAGVYTSTLLYFLRESNDLEASLAFLDRRLANVGKIGKLRARLPTPTSAN